MNRRSFLQMLAGLPFIDKIKSSNLVIPEYIEVNGVHFLNDDTIYAGGSFVKNRITKWDGSGNSWEWNGTEWERLIPHTPNNPRVFSKVDDQSASGT